MYRKVVDDVKCVVVTLLILLTAMCMSLTNSGCGGGGGGGVLPENTFTPTIIFQSTSTPILTATNTTTATAINTVITTVVATNTIAATIAPTITSTVATLSLTGTVKDLFTGLPVSGAKVTMGTISATTNSSGNYSLYGIKNVKGGMVVSANGYFDYSLPIDQAQGSSKNISLVANSFNNACYEAYLYNKESRRWLKVPKFVIYNKRQDDGVIIEDSIINAIKSVIVNELPLVTDNFISVSETDMKYLTEFLMMTLGYLRIIMA